MEKNMDIKIKRLQNSNGLDIPSYATSNSAGIDLQAAISEDIIIKPGKRVLIKTGIAIALPDGYEAQIRPRSGLAYKNGITVLNAPGTIDADYRGEIGVILINHSDEDFVVSSGMRIAQMIISSYTKANLTVVDELSETVRGEGGFGSTGLKQAL
jgi:dUTP pyrophosphatase